MKHVPSGAERQLLALGVPLREGVLERLEAFGDLLFSPKSRRFGNLMGPGEKCRYWIRHVLESAAFFPLLQGGASPVVDVGSGAGFPGVILAVFGTEITLVESRRKRFLFLLHAKEALDLEPMRIVHGRVEETGPYPQGTVFTARAVERPRTLPDRLAMAAPRGCRLITRCAPGVCPPRGEVLHELPAPPLDRPGFMVQFRHPGIREPRRDMKE